MFVALSICVSRPKWRPTIETVCNRLPPVIRRTAVFEMPDVAASRDRMRRVTWLAVDDGVYMAERVLVDCVPVDVEQTSAEAVVALQTDLSFVVVNYRDSFCPNVGQYVDRSDACWKRKEVLLAPTFSIILCCPRDFARVSSVSSWLLWRYWLVGKF